MSYYWPYLISMFRSLITSASDCPRTCLQPGCFCLGLGKVYSWNFSCEKCHIKIFSSSWVKYSHLLNFIFYIFILEAADKKSFNFSQTTVYLLSYYIYASHCFTWSCRSSKIKCLIFPSHFAVNI